MCTQRLPARTPFALLWAVFYRLCVAFIVGFWLLMAGLLVRTVWFRGDVPPTPVPTEYIGHLIFRHELASDLVLYRQRRRVDGTFHFQPKRLEAGSLVSASGSFPLALPGVAGQRVAFHGSLEMDAREQVRRVDLSVSLREPKGNDPGTSLHLDGQPVENRWHYQLLRDGATLHEGSGTPAELLAALEPCALGLDPTVLTRAAARPGAVTVTAHRGKLHVNQVGQVVAVKTFLGFDLYDETLLP